MTENIYTAYTQILKEELVPAMGCTEPIAIAYASSILRNALGEEPTSIRAGFSGNIIKNVKSVIVPATDGLKGIPVAIAAGVISNAPEKQLQVLCALGVDGAEKIHRFLEDCPIEIYKIDGAPAFEIDIEGQSRFHSARVRFIGAHTNIDTVELDGKDISRRYAYSCAVDSGAGGVDRSLLNVMDIVQFADTVDLGELRPYLTAQAEMNMAIAREGLNRAWGASIGQLLYNDGNCDLRTRAKAYAAAASDARMSGCEMPVCILSGSGNQGITASVPVLVYGEALGADEEKILRAMIVSNLITVHQKSGIGCLSAYCGAISAGCGCGTGICYLYGGGFREIAHSLVNSVAILSGTICDGAKSSCAAKIAMAVEAGIMGYEMFASGRQFYGGDGIVSKGVENTIKNVGRLARDGMKATDEQIIEIMLQK